MNSGEEAFRRYIDGDEAAFAQVQKIYFDRLVLFINRYLHDLDSSADVAIDTMVELVIHSKRYNFKTSLKTYLFSIGRHKALDYLRRHRKITLTQLCECEDKAELISLEDKILLEERKKALNAAIETLPQDMKAVIHLVYFEDLSCEDAAKVLKKNRKQVYNLLYRAKEMLRSILEEGGI